MIQTTTILSCSSCDTEIRGAYLRVVDDARSRGWDLRNGRERCAACVELDAAEAMPPPAEAVAETTVEPVGCNVVYSPRTCERGTKGCITLHSDRSYARALRNHVPVSQAEMVEHAANFEGGGAGTTYAYTYTVPPSAANAKSTAERTAFSALPERPR